MNIQLQAEVEGLKDEIMKQQRHLQIAQEVQKNKEPRRQPNRFSLVVVLSAEKRYPIAQNLQKKQELI